MEGGLRVHEFTECVFGTISAVLGVSVERSRLCKVSSFAE